jgi:hypothetical protein
MVSQDDLDFEEKLKNVDLMKSISKELLVPFNEMTITNTKGKIMGSDIPVRQVKGMDIGQAVYNMKQGYKVAREGWNGKQMFLFLVPGSKFKVNRAPLLGIYPEGTEIDYLSHVDMKTASGEIVPWLCSQSDLLANDWCIVE